MRERRGARLGPAVSFLFMGVRRVCVPRLIASTRLQLDDLSGDSGFDVFAVDLQGYGSSSKPTSMDDPCNTSPPTRRSFTHSEPSPGACPPRYPHSFGSFATDWDEIDAVVEFIRSIRGDRALKASVGLGVGWAIGYAALYSGQRRAGRRSSRRRGIRRRRLCRPIR